MLARPFIPWTGPRRLLTAMDGPERPQTLKAIASAQFSRVASSNVVNKAADIASRLRAQAVQSYNQAGDNEGRSQQQQGWGAWAWEKLPKRGNNTPNLGIEKVMLFPGWATRRYHSESEFSVDVHVSGFGSNLRPPELATRSQRAFMKMARSFAALPPLPVESLQEGVSGSGVVVPQQAWSKSEQDLVRELPPQPSEMSEEDELKAIQAEFEPLPSHLPSGLPEPVANASDYSLSELKKMHENLDLRLQPLWSTTLPNRVVRLSVYAPQTSSTNGSTQIASSSPLPPELQQPILTVELPTDFEGTFSSRITLDWETLCTHPDAVSIAFGERLSEPNLVVHAELLPAPAESAVGEAPTEPVPVKKIATHITIPITQAKARLISDVDDTIKLAGIVAGARTVFRNVFTKDPEELVIKEMGDWYRSLYTRGIRFHYVSNSPFGLLPIINEFMTTARLPEGSIRLKFYNGKSFFTSVWEPAGERKRAGVIEVLDNFIESRFFLVGDTGEQDLELYVDVAKERPGQILGIFIRDVTSGPDQLSDSLNEAQVLTNEPESIAPTPPTSGRVSAHESGSPTSQRSLPYEPRRSGTDQSRKNSKVVQQQPQPVPRMQAQSGSSVEEDSPMPGRNSPPAQMTVAERRRWELQQRIAKARQMLPMGITLKIFKEPDECTETHQILDQLGYGTPNKP